MKTIRIFLLVLIIIGLGLLAAQSLWVPPLVNWILSMESPVATVQKAPTTPAPTPVTGTTPVTKRTPPTPAPVPAPVSTGTLSGTVTLSPTCPVERMPPDPQCAPRPYVSTVSVTQAGASNVVATKQTNADGSFSFTLAPGSYTVEAAGAAVYPRCSAVQATVTKDSNTTSNISCDSGIR